MAELSQVLSTVTNLVASAVYPSGTGQPSVAGVQVTIESGWPIRTQLDKDLKSGYAHVSVYPTNKERVVTKFGREFESDVFTAPTIVLTTTINTIVFSGTVTLPQAIVVILNGITYSYLVQSGDTLSTIATNVAALLPAAIAVGTTITISNSQKLIARVSSNYSAAQELSRQEREFRITCWAPTDPIRTALAGAIDIVMKQNYRIVLPDNFIAQVFYSHQDDFDTMEKSLVYQRVLYYNIQYATTVTNNYMTIESIVNNVDVVTQI